MICNTGLIIFDAARDRHLRSVPSPKLYDLHSHFVYFMRYYILSYVKNNFCTAYN
jgi:hypothetical protein